MSGVILKGQSVGWPMAFWQDDAETIELDCTGATLSVINNSMGVPVSVVWTDQAHGKAKLVIISADTQRLKVGRYGTFRVKLSHPTEGDVVYPNADILVE